MKTLKNSIFLLFFVFLLVLGLGHILFALTVEDISIEAKLMTEREKRMATIPVLYGYVSTWEAKKVALTFDDGPKAGFTDRILDVLKKKNAKATFFLIGWGISEHPDLVRRIVAEGHDIGIHGLSHVDLEKLSPFEIEYELTKTRELIQKETGAEIYFFRPPGGDLNDEVLGIARKYGLSAIMWKKSIGDYTHKDGYEPDPEDILKRAKKHFSNGGIVIFHEGLESTITALPEVIDYYRANGYCFKRVSDWYR
ncbi:MAG: polysaccharide deacetylase family protein [Candidatus Saganbacteria bacterium]|nr:polysaccharide deacetylase family protein [Candidatus Saganbacteria bacterium]